MKILKLRFKNLNSLKGENEINFTVPPLSETGIFAITGPTGAGKSTILDAITLALYNQTPRSGINSKKSLEKTAQLLRGTLLKATQRLIMRQMENNTVPNGRFILPKKAVLCRIITWNFPNYLKM